MPNNINSLKRLLSFSQNKDLYKLEEKKIILKKLRFSAQRFLDSDLQSLK